MSRDTSVYEGDMPTRAGEIALEMHGMAPIPADNRYGGIHRIFTVWFTPNLVPAAFFVGALAPVLGLGFGFGLAAILLGTILGALLVSVLCTWGPRTGVGQLPLARLQFGKTVAVPGLLGGLALVAIWIGTVAVNAMNDYSGSLALQAAGFRVRRPVVAAIVSVLAFFLTLWLNTGDLATKFENVLLFITYWIPPFAAIQMVDWYRKRGVMNVGDVVGSSLQPGWDALIALAAGFAAALPFMDTTLYVGWASSHWLQGGDIAFPVGFVVGLAVYAGIRRAQTGTLRDPAAAAAGA